MPESLTLLYIQPTANMGRWCLCSPLDIFVHPLSSLSDPTASPLSQPLSSPIVTITWWEGDWALPGGFSLYQQIRWTLNNQWHSRYQWRVFGGGDFEELNAKETAWRLCSVDMHLDTVWEEEDGTNREWHGNIYITICKINSQWEFAVWCRELNLCWDSALWQPRGVGCRGEGREVQ